MRAFDFDGVITEGFHPTADDIIITGRAIDEYRHVTNYLKALVIPIVPIYFNPVLYDKRGDKTVAARQHSGNHKANTLLTLLNNEVPVEVFFEDDPLQAEIMEAILPKDFDIVLVGTWNED